MFLVLFPLSIWSLLYLTAICVSGAQAVMAECNKRNVSLLLKEDGTALWQTGEQDACEITVMHSVNLGWAVWLYFDRPDSRYSGVPGWLGRKAIMLLPGNVSPAMSDDSDAWRSLSVWLRYKAVKGGAALLS